LKIKSQFVPSLVNHSCKASYKTQALKGKITTKGSHDGGYKLPRLKMTCHFPKLSGLAPYMLPA